MIRRLPINAVSRSHAKYAIAGSRIYAAAYSFSEDGKAVVDLFPAMNVVPITFSRDEYLVSCDKLNLGLHIFRAILPPGTMITVQNAARAEREQLRSKRATKNGGLWTLVREKKACMSTNPCYTSCKDAYILRMVNRACTQPPPLPIEIPFVPGFVGVFCRLTKACETARRTSPTR